MFLFLVELGIIFNSFIIEKHAFYVPSTNTTRIEVSMLCHDVASISIYTPLLCMVCGEMA